MTSAKRWLNCLHVSQLAVSFDLCQMSESCRGLAGGDSWALGSGSGEVWRRRLCGVSSPTVNGGAAFNSVHVRVSCVSLYCFEWFSVKELLGMGNSPFHSRQVSQEIAAVLRS